eukprot:TRINITY_DN4878_c0_g2_i1.p1 TRINITY_DN4878_c0_g2~~TRINITY_DN4878_c0_g2_i1.p1  ORF type:complete len:573 (-),score=128.95 TRINITY_DN4878_c0_g2_i1:207-1925(-)
MAVTEEKLREELDLLRKALLRDLSDLILQQAGSVRLETLDAEHSAVSVMDEIDGGNASATDSPQPEDVLDAEEDPEEEDLANQVLDKSKERALQFKKKRGLLDIRMAGSEEMNEELLYDVTNFYHSKGICQKLARSERFGNLTLAVITMNAIYLGIDADTNDAETLLEAPWYYQLCENLFCLFFTFELLVRFGAFRNKLDCLKDAWFKFDGCLVTLMVGETWLMTIILAALGGDGVALPTAPLRLLRLLRLSRLVRLMRSMPELLTLVNGMRVASRAVGSSLLLILLLIYIYGIVMHMFLSEEAAIEKKYFGSLLSCMWTLLMDGTFQDGTATVLGQLLDLGYWPMVVVFLTFILISAMTIMNMLIGVLCEVVSAVKHAEEQQAALEIVKGTVLVLLKKLDMDESGDIDKIEMQAVLERDEALDCLEQLGVDVPHLLDMLDMMYEDQGALSMVQLMELMLALRGDQPVDKKDFFGEITFLRWDIKHQIRQHENRMKEMMIALSLPTNAIGDKKQKSLMHKGATRVMAAKEFLPPGVPIAMDLPGMVMEMSNPPPKPKLKVTQKLKGSVAAGR